MDTKIGQWFENLKIKFKLTLSVSLILLLIMVFIYLYFPAQQRRAVYKEMDQRITYLAKSMALGYGVAMTENIYWPMHVIGSWVKDDRNFAYYIVFDENNDVVDAYPEFAKTVSDTSIKDLLPVKHNNVLEIKAPIYSKEHFLGYVILGMDLKDVNAAVSRINRASTIILLIVYTAALFIVLFISLLLNKPINSLMNSVNRVIQHGDYSERVIINSSDEAGILASRFNDMIEIIEERDVELKQQYEELQKVNELKDHFLAATTHDLRSPITAILGFTDLIAMNENLDEGDRKRLDHIRTSTKFLATLVEDILEISRLESDKSELKRKPILLATVIESSISTLHYMALPKEIPIEFFDKSDGNNKVNGDPDALLRIMNNLISNAIKFTPRGGKITVMLESGGGQVKVSVTDTGIGIPEEKIPLLFQTYTRISRFGTAGEKGTGLGLSITMNLVGKHEGDITVSSRENEGTCFTVTIPLYSEKDEINKETQ